MNHWAFVTAAYAVVLGGAGVLALFAWVAMRRAEKQPVSSNDER